MAHCLKKFTFQNTVSSNICGKFLFLFLGQILVANHYYCSVVKESKHSKPSSPPKIYPGHQKIRKEHTTLNLFKSTLTDNGHIYI